MTTYHPLATPSAKPEAGAPPARLCLTLPYPPSVNHYWRRRGRMYFISKEGIFYREAVMQNACDAGITAPITGWLHVSVLASAPDRRRRDLDNISKALLDALAHAGLYADDAQISRLELCWMEPGHAQVHVTVRELEQRYIPFTQTDEASR